MVDMEG